MYPSPRVTLSKIYIYIKAESHLGVAPRAKMRRVRAVLVVDTWALETRYGRHELSQSNSVEPNPIDFLKVKYIIVGKY